VSYLRKQKKSGSLNETEKETIKEDIGKEPCQLTRKNKIDKEFEEKNKII